MGDPVPTVWPATLMIRDTGLHDDMGGGGQRIYTTAGRGYEKRKYVYDARVAQFEAIAIRVAALDLGPKGYCSGSLFKLREDAMNALASDR